MCSKDEVSADAHREKVVAYNWPVHTSTIEIQQFLGLAKLL